MGYFAVGLPKVLRARPRALSTTAAAAAAAATGPATPPRALAKIASPPLSPRTLPPLPPPSQQQQQQPMATPDTAVQLQPSPDGRFVAALCAYGRLSLWDGRRHRALLLHSAPLPLPSSQPQQQQQQPEVVGVCWGPPLRRAEGVPLLACTRNGDVFRFLLQRAPRGVAPQPLSRNCPPLAAAAVDDDGDGDATAVQLTREEDATAHVDGVVTAVASAGCGDGLLLGTRDGRVVCVGWDCNIVGSAQVPRPEGSDALSSPEIAQLAFCPERKLIAATFAEDGRGVICDITLLSAADAKEAGGSRVRVVLLANIACSDRISSAAFNPRLPLLAVGCENGSVEIHRADPTGSDAPVSKIERVLSLAQWGISGRETGKACQVSWSPEGSAIAVGWQCSGISVWSLHGCRLMSTAAAGSAFAEEKEFLKNGVAALCWVAKGFGLLVAEYGRDGWLVEVPFLKTTQWASPSMHTTQPAMLVGSDEIWLLSHRDNASLDFSWSCLRAPEEYIASNWPIEHVAIDTEGRCIAVSGLRGLAICFCATGQWKLFGDRHFEQSIRCLGLCWFENLIVAAVRSGEGKDFSIQVFSRKHLARSSRLGVSPLTKRPAFIEATVPYVSVLAADGVFTQFLLVPHIEDGVTKAVDITRIKQLNFASPSHILGIAIFRSELVASLRKSRTAKTPSSPAIAAASSSSEPPPSPAATKGESTPRTIEAAAAAAALKVVVLNDNGDVYVKDTLDGSIFKINEGVEEFWLRLPKAVSRRRQQECIAATSAMTLESVLWTYGNKGLQFWPGFTGDAEADAEREPLSLVELLDDVYPVGIMQDHGVVVGLFQHSTPFTFPLASTIVPPPPPLPSLPQFQLRTKSHPFVHRMLAQALEEQDSVRVDAIVRKIRGSPVFSLALELLLFEAFEASPRNADTPDPRLKEVVRFIQGFPSEFPAVVARCARKTESTAWRYLFSITGDPLPLFQSCLAQDGMLNVAASILYILLELHGEERTVQSAAKLLDLVLATTADFELAGDILRFVRNLCHTADGADRAAAINEVLERHGERILAAGDAARSAAFQKLLVGK